VPLLEVRELKLHYSTPRGPVRAVDGASFTMEEGEALGMVGESGSGKSSLAMALLRMLPANVALYQGSVRVEGTEVMGLSDEEFRRGFRWKKLSMAFQGAMNALNPVLRVGNQIGETLLLDGALSKREVRRKVEELLERVGLPTSVFQRYPHELSGGMKQRAVIAMALIQNPTLVILDEPTSALDVSIQAQITNLLKRLQREMGLSIIFITHDIALASDICDRIAVVYGGQVVELGGMEEVLLRPQHPYTEKLLASLPRLDSDTAPEFIPGTPPDLVEPPTGCRFHPRCPYAFAPCAGKEPPLLGVGPGHTARCWLREGDATPHVAE
jgi:oligopeptide/dipeptide ABC transporter ATP-binding protein